MTRRLLSEGNLFYRVGKKVADPILEKRIRIRLFRKPKPDKDHLEKKIVYDHLQNPDSDDW